LHGPPPPHSKTVVVVPGRLDSNGQEANAGTEPLSPLASRTTRRAPPPPCSYAPDASLHWRWRASDGRTAPWYCDRWDCPSCAPQKASRWADIIALASPQRHIVLTRLGPAPDLARSQLQNIIKALRRGQAIGAGRRLSHVEFEYFAALETHACGYVHAHLLQRGRSVPKRQLSRMLPGYGAGSICWIRSISEAQRPAAVARYVARHLVGHEHADQIKAGRRVRYSRRFWGGCTVAQVAAALWPRLPDAATWVLEGPGRVMDPEMGALNRPAFRTRQPYPLSPAMQTLARTAARIDLEAAHAH
jgi:hypothetical protein